MKDTPHQPQPLERLSSSITGLDVILGGGFLQGGIYILMGQPGAGKTILGNQISFGHVATGGRAVYVTLLAEAHGRMLAHLQSLRFFRTDPIPGALLYLSGYSVLEKDGLAGLLDLLRKVIRSHEASVLVLDGLVSAEALADSDLALKKFIHELQVMVGVVGCTVFLSMNACFHAGDRPEHTMVDGIVELLDHNVGLRTVRELEVRKFRGSGYLRGRHQFDINDAGIVVYPRTEERFRAAPLIAQEDRSRMRFGVHRLDEMLRGGLLSGSSTMLLGPPGSGKTLLGLHFLTEGAKEEQRGLYYGFNETPPRLKAKAAHVGLDLGQQADRGLIEVMWQPPLEQIIDALAENLLDALKRHRAQRLFIDGVGAFREATTCPERIGRFLTALTLEVRALGVTLLLAEESPFLFSARVEMPDQGLSSIAENILVLRHMELRSQLYHLISVRKVRESGYDPAIHEFRITSRGIEVAHSPESAEAILLGQTPVPVPRGRRHSTTDERKPRGRGR